jgi:hypothetical protein
MTAEHWIDLNCHPSTRTETVGAVKLHVRRSASELRTTFRLDGDLHRISIPSPGAPRIGTELWRHTCFEVFLAVEGQAAYHEFNFAPSGEWTVYAFTGYRSGSPLADEMLLPHIAVRTAGNQLELDSRLRLDALSAIHPRAALRIGLAAIIEASDGTLSYWALCHPAGRPDFHNADGFALLLDPPRPE